MHRVNIFAVLFVGLLTDPTVISFTKQNSADEDDTEVWGTVPKISDEKDQSLLALALSDEHEDSSEDITISDAYDDEPTQQWEPWLTEIIQKGPRLIAAYKEIAQSVAVLALSKDVVESQESTTDKLYAKDLTIRVHVSTKPEKSESNLEEKNSIHTEPVETTITALAQTKGKSRNNVATENSEEEDSDEDDSDKDYTDEDYTDEDYSSLHEIPSSLNLNFGSSPQIRKCQEITRMIRIIHKMTPCSLTPDQTTWCLDGNCRYSSLRNPIKDLTIPWKPKYPLSASVQCDDEFTYKFWNFGQPLGVATFFIDEAFTIEFDIEKTLLRILQTLRPQLIEWNLNGTDQYTEQDRKQYLKTGHYLRKEADYQIMIGNEDANTFTVRWSNGDNVLALNTGKSGLTMQKWFLGPTITVGVTIDHDSQIELEKWQIAENTLSIWKMPNETKISGQKKYIETMKTIKRYITEWCEQNSHWLMPPFKTFIHKMTKTTVI